MSSEIRVTDFPRAHKFELFLNGSGVSSLIINDLELKVGGVYLKTGGVGGVETVEKYRLKGYSRKVIEDSLDYITRNGYDVSMLFGIPDYYVRWGYASTLANCKITIPIRNAEKARLGLHPRPMSKEDAEKVLDIYELTNHDRTGPLKRHRGEWFNFRKGSMWGVPADGTVLEDDSGNIVAYFAADRSTRAVRITEVGAKEVSFYENLLRYVSDVALQKRAMEVEIYIPFNHPFAELCKSLGCTVTINYPYASDGMGRIINLRSTFEKLVPELENRLRKTYGKTLPSKLEIKTDIGSITLEISGPEISLSDSGSANWISLPQWVLMQLIMGYRSSENVLVDPFVKHEGEVSEALKILFPNGYPYIWNADYF